MTWGIIGTWAMSFEGIKEATRILKTNQNGSVALVEAIKNVENNPYYKSVGYGGLPNEDCIVELDAGYMDGNTLGFGAVAGIKDIANPIEVAKSLSVYKANNFLIGDGAKEYAIEHGFETKNMLTDRAIIHYKNKLKTMNTELSAYDGHDTVGMISLSSTGMYAGTSTSGLFMKKTGRVGDSCVIGSGLYVNSDIGGASGTGLGEDLMKGCVSFKIVDEMERGLHPQKACEKVVFELEELLKKRRDKVGDLSVVAMNRKGEWGVASNIDTFSFVVGTEHEEPKVYLTKRVGNTMVHTPATIEWIQDYEEERTRTLVEV